MLGTGGGDMGATRPLTVQSLAAAKHLPVELLESLGVTNDAKGIVIPYGDGVRSRLRSNVKAGSGTRWLGDRTQPMALYGPGLRSPAARAEAEGTLVIVEGESDCWTLWHHDYVANGVPGASMVKFMQPEHLVGVETIYVVQEPDEAGAGFVDDIADRVWLLGNSMAWRMVDLGLVDDFEEVTLPNVLRVPMPEWAKDPSGLHCWLAEREKAGDFRAVFDALLSDAALVERPSRFNIIRGDEIERLPPPEWLVEGFLVEGSLAMLFGEPGIGKSFVALDLAGHIASGMPWHEREVRQGVPLYILAEGSGDVGVRATAMREHHGFGTTSMAYITEPVNLFEGEVGFLLDDLFAASITPKLVVVDTLARSMDGGDESFGKDMAKVIKSCDRLRHEIGATVVLIHHSGHEAKSRGRGSSNLPGAVDTLIRMKRQSDLVTLTCEKMRSGPDFDPITVALRPYGDSLVVVDGDALVLDDKELACLRLVPDEGITHKAWKEGFLDAELGKPRTFDRRRDRLVQKGAVAKKSDGDGAVYLLTDEARDQLGVTDVT
jgi:hypothetical protein